MYVRRSYKTIMCRVCKGKGYTLFPIFKFHMECGNCKGKGTIRKKLRKLGE